MTRTVNRKELEILESDFEAEIQETRSKVAQSLADNGLLYRVVLTQGSGIAVKVEGYMLTERGRLEYCRRAAKVDC